jgi:polyene glycosyltransferase
MSGGILFATKPAIGLTNPLLAMAGELKRRGVPDVFFATNDERRADVEGLPGDGHVTFVPLGPFQDDLWPQNWPHKDFSSTTMRGRLKAVAHYFESSNDFEYFHVLFMHLIEVFKETKPALAVVDIYSPYAVDAALMMGVPYIANISTPPSMAYAPRLPAGYPVPMSGLPRRMSTGQRLANAGFRAGVTAVTYRPRYLRGLLGLYRLRKKGGFANPTMAPWRYACSAAAVLGDSVFGLDYEFPPPANLTMVGAVLPAEADELRVDGELGEWLDRHESVVYVGFGTLMSLSHAQVAAVVQTARRLGRDHQVLWKLPREQQQLLPAAGHMPANLRVEEWLPSQLAVLNHPHVRVFFNHGGGNAVHESLYYATPMLVMPYWLDCYDLAARVVDSGAGLAVEHRPEPDVADIVGKLQRLLDDDGFGTRARHWSQRLRDAGGANSAADIIVATRDRVLTRARPDGHATPDSHAMQDDAS